MTKKKSIIILIVIAILCVLFIISTPKTSYMQYNDKETAAFGISDCLIWDYRFYNDLSTVTFYQDVWTGGECILSEKIATMNMPEKGKIAIRNSLEKARNNADASTTIAYDMLVIVEEKKITHVYEYTRYDDLVHPGPFVAALTSFAGADANKKLNLTPDNNYILYLQVINSTDGFSSAPIEEFDKWVEIFEEDKDSSFIVVRMETK